MKKLLLHICCAPCAGHLLNELRQEFDLTTYFYNPNLDSKEEYQKGCQLNFFNVREYVLFRDKHTCQLCKKKNKVLNIHHIVSRKTGSNAPDNLITLCIDCHKKVHLERKSIIYSNLVLLCHCFWHSY